MMNNQREFKKAFAFSITMWIVASLLLATVVILRFAKDELRLSVGLNDKLKTELIANTVLETLKFYVPTADYTFTSLKNSHLTALTYPFPEEIVVDGREYNLTKKITISLKDTSSMLHVMYASSEMIASALTNKSDESAIATLTDALEDWRDEDNAPRVNGAEESSYRSLGQQVLVRNSKAIQDIHELKLIQGFENIDFEKLKRNLYYGRGSGINLMLINNRRYLANLLAVDEKFMEEMLELRVSEPKKFMRSIELLEHYNDDYFGFYLSKQFRIIIKVQEGEARTILEAILSFKYLNDRPYITVSYLIK